MRVWKKKITYKGCKLSIPKFEAIMPVMKGRRTLPPAPQAAIHPTVPFTRWRGRTRAVWFIAIGYIGPKRIPITVTETAAAVKEGTSQTINWKLFPNDELRCWTNYKRWLTISRRGYNCKWRWRLPSVTRASDSPGIVELRYEVFYLSSHLHHDDATQSKT